MAQAASASAFTLNSRRLVADAILKGYADTNVAAVLTTAASNGYAAGVGGALTNAAVGGILGSVNR